MVKKYTLTLEFEANDENGLNPVEVSAESVHVGADWVIFNAGTSGTATTVVAAFPKDRVVSVVREDA